VQCAPIVRLVPDEIKPTIKLKWFPVKRGKDDAGELLAAFELFLVNYFVMKIFLKNNLFF